jgi:predicted RNase H-like nuclease (RuvC/YqgF family)
MLDSSSSEIKALTNLVLEMVKSNTELQKQQNELQKQNSDLQKQVLDVCKNSNTTNHINSHNNNKTFNLQFFLNEQCKDAMNISDFANSFDLQLSDLESVGELGYVEGITKIFVDKLNSMDIYKRPIHCSDAKREIIYVKDDNKWEREERSNPKLRYAIKTISFRNMKLANLWSDTYPESKDGDSHMNDTYMKLIKESTGGNGEISISEDKIIRRIAKEILIDKK